MSHLALSDDLIQITGEINVLKQQFGITVFEIGRRLKHVKDNDLAHGQWTSWLKSMDIEPRTAQRMIQAFDQFGNTTTSSLLPTGKIFEMLSLPDSIDRQEFTTKSHVIPSTGENKSVDEMTVKELREVKKALQEAERAAAQAQATAETEKNSARHFEKLWQQAKNQPPRVETKTVEIVPRDYEELKRQAEEFQRLNSEHVKLQRDLTSQREQYEEKLSVQQKRDSAKRDLQKFLAEHLRAMSMNHDSAIFNYTLIQGDTEAHNMVTRFLEQYEAIIKKQFAEWEQLTTLRAVN